MERNIRMKRLFLTIITALAFAGCTPSLHKAAREGDADRVRKLLDAGADVNVKNANTGRLQYTPLHWAAYYGHLEIAELLISRGADLDAEDPDYSTPLYLAAEQGHPKVVEFLISKGAEVNVKSSRWGYTPLHRAAWGPVTLRKHFGAGEEGTVSEADLNGNYLEIVGMLLEKGAKVDVLDNDGKTPLDQAIKNSEKEIVDLLRKHGAKTGKEFAERFKDYFVGTIKIRFHQAELSEDRKRVPWTGYGVDGGFPGTVVTAVEITNASGTYSLPANMVNDLGNPNIGHVHVRQNGKLLELSMNNSDGAGGHNALFKVDLAKAQACRFVKVAIDDDHTKTHDWTALKKRK
jgi:hypothetical protein